MSKHHSVRLRLIGWCCGLLDHLAKYPMDGLRCGKVHPQSRADVGLWGGVNVNNRLSERQVDRSVVVSGLGDQINMGGGCGFTSNHPSLIAYLERVRFEPNVAGVAHQISPIGTAVDISSMNMPRGGVEP